MKEDLTNRLKIALHFLPAFRVLVVEFDDIPRMLSNCRR